jgi:hypothetical protein
VKASKTSLDWSWLNLSSIIISVVFSEESIFKEVLPSIHQGSRDFKIDSFGRWVQYILSWMNPCESQVATMAAAVLRVPQLRRITRLGFWCFAGQKEGRHDRTKKCCNGSKRQTADWVLRRSHILPLGSIMIVIGTVWC